MNLIWVSLKLELVWTDAWQSCFFLCIFGTSPPGSSSIFRLYIDILLIEISVLLWIWLWWSIGMTIRITLDCLQVLDDNLINQELEEKMELIWHEKGVDLHDEDLVIVTKSLEDHDPEWVWDLVQVVHLAIVRVPVSDQHQNQTVIISIVHELNEDALVIDWVDEESVDGRKLRVGWDHLHYRLHLLLDALLPFVEVTIGLNTSPILTIAAHLRLEIVFSEAFEGLIDLSSDLLRVELVDMQVGRLETRLNLRRISVGASLLCRCLLLLRRIYGQESKSHLGTPNRVSIVVDQHVLLHTVFWFFNTVSKQIKLNETIEKWTYCYLSYFIYP